MELNPIIIGLIAANNRLTEFVKIWLNAPTLPINPSAEVKRVIVLFASVLIGIVSVWLTPNSLAYAGERAIQYPVPMAIVTGVAVSFGGAFAQPFFELFGTLNKFAASKVVEKKDPLA